MDATYSRRFHEALLLAARDDEYYDLSMHIALIIFSDTPEFKGGVPKSEIQVLQLLSGSELGSCSPAALLKELPLALDTLTWAYPGISSHYELCIRNESGKDSWSFAPGDEATEAISDRVNRVVDKSIRLLPRDIVQFMQTLSKVDKSNHQVPLHAPFIHSPWWNTEPHVYEAWKREDNSAPNILYLHGIPESSSATLASQLHLEMTKSFEKAIIITYSFQKQDLRTQTFEAFFTSLIRQILRTRSSLFRRVDSVAKQIQKEMVFSYEVLKSLLLSLLRACFDKPIVLVLSGGQDCSPGLMENLAGLVREYRSIATGGFKIAILAERIQAHRLEFGHDISCEIDLSGEEPFRVLHGAYVESRLGILVKSHPQLSHYNKDVIERLTTGRSLVQAGLTASLLESWRISSTDNATKNALESLPSTVDDLFMMTMRHCEKHSDICIRPLVQWILHAVRPPNIRQLSVVVALCSTENASMEELRLNLPSDLPKDIEELSNTLVGLFGTQVLPIYGVVGRELFEREGLSSHLIIVSKCLDYLEAIFDNLTIGDFSADDETWVDTIRGPVTELLVYAVKEWPQHYNLASTVCTTARDCVLDFLSKEKYLKLWFALYQRYTDFEVETYYELDSALKVACWFGLVDVAKKVIEQTKEDEDGATALRKALDLAAGNGQEDLVVLLLEAGASYEFGLCWASEGGFYDIVKTLLETDTDAINRVDRWDRTPFLLAALGGNEKIAAYLLDHGADPSRIAGFNLTALHLAVMTGQMAIVQRLLNADVDVNVETGGGNNALRLAAAGGFDQIVKLLLERETDVDGMNHDGMTALHLAVENGHASICKLLFGAGASVQITTPTRMSSLHIAAKEGFVDIVQWIFTSQRTREGMEPTSTQRSVAGNKNYDKQDKPASAPLNDSTNQPSPLQLAAQNGNNEVVHELLKRMAHNTEQERSISLRLAAEAGFIEIVEEILKFGTVTAIRNVSGRTALHLATQKQHTAIVSRLSKLKSSQKVVFDINEKDQFHWTPLHYAALSGRYVTLLVLLDHGAKITDATSSYHTAFHIAAFNGHSFVLKELLRRLDGKKNSKQTERQIGKKALPFAKDKDGHTAFTLAVKRGHTDVMNTLLERTPSSSDKIAKLQGDQKNALNIAIKGLHLQAAGLLIENGWDVNDPVSKGDKPIHLAAAVGNVPLIELFIAKGAEVDAPGEEGKTPLHYAASGHPDAVEALLDSKLANINAVDSKGATPLWNAAYSGATSCVEVLLKHSPDLNAIDNSLGWTALHCAYDYPDITKLLLDAGADPTCGGTQAEPLLHLVSDEPTGLQSVQHYLKAKIDPNTRNARGLTAIHTASESIQTNRLDVIKLLTSHGADVTATGQDGQTALHLAANADHQEVVDYLLEIGTDVNQHSTCLGTPLMAAAKGAGAQIVKALLENGADVNATSDDFSYHTALQAAAWSKSKDVVQLLLEWKADVNLVGGEYGSALCAAASVGHEDISTLLLEAGADINYLGGPKGTPLECALRGGYISVARLCLDRNASLNLVSTGDRGTALVAAIHSESLEMVQDLLTLGADPNLGSEKGEVPIQAAIRKGHQDILNALLDRGGKLSFRDKYGRGAISNIIVYNSPGLLPCMWDREDVDFNETDAVKRTPLMLAVLLGVNIVQELHQNGAALDLQDQWGNTALAYAIICDYSSMVSELIECHASPFVRDSRQRDALYWACRGSSLDTFNEVYQEMSKLKAVPGIFQAALNAAVASGGSVMVGQLLGKATYSQKQFDTDGWSARHMALRYYRPELDEAITNAILESCQRPTDPLPAVRLPTKWHESDLSIALLRGEDPRTITVSKTVNPLRKDPPIGMVRADHAMWPQDHAVYYFEVTIADQGDDDKKRFAIGFCEETTSLGLHLGWESGSWGYHGDDGKTFSSAAGSPYGPTFGQGDVIGCGVNFDKKTAFYTRNGEIIGQAFFDIRGKLYPAMSLDIRQTNCAFSARFWDTDDIGNQDFMFKGPFNDPKTFQESERAVSEREAQHGSDSKSDDSTSVSSSEDSWFLDE
ncbi:hypothetical protein H9Q70_005580 [Fusarium xylarioides]|nr:hypothetical protein H9Q70_005580 [Fusarium xylarioides]